MYEGTDDFTTTSTTWVDVPRLRVERETNGSMVHVEWALVGSAPDGILYLRLVVDDEPDNNLIVIRGRYQQSIDGLNFPNVKKGRHTFYFQARVDRGVGYVHHGDGTTWGLKLYAKMDVTEWPKKIFDIALHGAAKDQPLKVATGGVMPDNARWDAARIIAALVADEDAGGDFEMHCIYCEPAKSDPAKVLHAPDCPILAGRAWLAAQEAKERE
jgi:hypothetical protein